MKTVGHDWKLLGEVDLCGACKDMLKINITSKWGVSTMKLHMNRGRLELSFRDNKQALD